MIMSNKVISDKGGNDYKVLISEWLNFSGNWGCFLGFGTRDKLLIWQCDFAQGSLYKKWILHEISLKFQLA